MAINRLVVKRGIYNGIDFIGVVGPFNAMDDQIDTIADEIIAQGKTDMVFDFSETTYLTSSGMAALIKVLKKVQRVQGILYIANITQDMNELICNSSLDRFLQYV